MFCSKCGSKIEKGAKFCSKCGALVKGAEKEKKEPYVSKMNNEVENKFIPVVMSIFVFIKKYSIKLYGILKKFFIMVYKKLKKIFIASSILVRTLMILAIPLLILIILLVSRIDFKKDNDNNYNDDKNNIKSSVVSVGVKADDLGNIVNGQYFFDDGTNQFYSTFDTSGNPHIYVTNKNSGTTKTIFDGFGWSFVVHDGWLYFSGNAGTSIDATYTLFRIRTDGSGLEHINYSYCVNMNFYKQWLYYTKKSDYYSDVSSVYRSSIDGTGELEIVSGVGKSGLSVVYDDKLYYLDQYGDIYRAEPDGTNKVKISTEVVDYFVIGASKIIYLDSSNNIKSTSLDGSDSKTIRVTDGIPISKLNSYKDTIIYIVYNTTMDQERMSYYYSIYSIKTTGTNDKKIYDGISWGFYINMLNDKVFVLDYAKDVSLNKFVAIARNMNLDGTNLQDIYR